MSVKWDKPLQTKLGKWPARFLGDVHHSQYPKAVAVMIPNADGNEHLLSFFENGDYPGPLRNLDLENVH